MTAPTLDLAPELRAMLAKHADRLDLDLIERALRFSTSAHHGQKRASGEEFISHSIAVAMILAEQLPDSTSIAAALLHDVVEDSDVGVEDIARDFGPEVGVIVDGLTKISHLTFRSTAEEQVENAMLRDHPSRVVNTLLRLAGGVEPTTDGHVVAISPLELSSRVGLDVDAVKKAVQQLRDGGYVRIAEERIIIPDLAALKQLYQLLGMKEDVRGGFP